MNQFLWIPGRGIDRAALARLRAYCRKPDAAMGEAWFMGERRMFPELFGDLDTLPLDTLMLALEEIASGTSSFGPLQEWRDWYHYLLGALLPRSHGFDVLHSLLEDLMSGFMTQYPNGVHRPPYPEFHEDVLLTLGCCLMEPECWNGTDIALGNVLRRSNDNPAGVWLWFDASGDLSASLFFCLKYLPEASIAPWLHSVLAIPAPHWRAQLMVWLTGAHDILAGTLAWPAQWPLDARPYVGWEWSHCLGPHLAQADESGAAPSQAFLPEGSRLQALRTLDAYFTEARYREWLAAISAVPEVVAELEGISALFAERYLRK